MFHSDLFMLSPPSCAKGALDPNIILCRSIAGLAPGIEDASRVKIPARSTICQAASSCVHPGNTNTPG